MVNRNLAAIFELLLALGALLGADLLALALALLVALPRLEGLDDGRVLPAALALQLGRVEQLALLVQLLQFTLLLLLTHTIQLLLLHPPHQNGKEMKRGLAKF